MNCHIVPRIHADQVSDLVVLHFAVEAVPDQIFLRENMVEMVAPRKKIICVGTVAEKGFCLCLSHRSLKDPKERADRR